MNNQLVYPREPLLSASTLILGLLVWLILIIGTFGGALIIILLGFLSYLFTQSALIARIKGNGVELSAAQFPDLYAQFVACCQRLNIKNPPHAYLLSGNGVFNAFATRFLGRNYVVLLSDIVDAMNNHPDGVRFYIGHELGHIRMGHLTGHLLRWPVLWLPLLGAAYARACENTCDRHGLACSDSPTNAAQAIACLAAGGQRWQQLNLTAYYQQAQISSGFWSSFHELIAGYPWITKRIAHVMDREAKLLPRHKLAYLLAAFVPYTGRLGAGFGVLILIYIVGILAAIAIPAYQDYQTRIKIATAYQETTEIRTTIAQHYLSYHQIPDSLDSLGIKIHLTNGAQLLLDANTMMLTLRLEHGELYLIPEETADGQINWRCSGSADLKPAVLPPPCRSQH
ncbi:M48 family metalloprotease [Rhodopseudomonas palustris]|uniref:M48 family metalloprotease n=1 Tax=Thiospirillum jenense TaxID=1653858 RepID=A0A839HCP0_9GAMM|nr:M48 family metalloprotease [Thiospirillum jenense]MBB1089699.1 M48 family metalloprotease [Rhodopseudomonas palustris]MBB1124799.1 M48 family metalloprotease [Thiospirillum jenense]